jgi:hypothetical protein
MSSASISGWLWIPLMRRSLLKRRFLVLQQDELSRLGSKFD